MDCASFYVLFDEISLPSPSNHSVSISSTRTTARDLLETMTDNNDNLSEFLLTLEDQFYSQGLDQGTPHGELHGLFEGRALGREKGWELWEEVGYYEGVAVFWSAVLASQGKQGRALLALDQVVTFVNSFPTVNDSSAEAAAASSPDMDIALLLTSIRSKYRAACATLGVRPRMVASSSKSGPDLGEAAQLNQWFLLPRLDSQGNHDLLCRSIAQEYAVISMKRDVSRDTALVIEDVVDDLDGRSILSI